MKLTKKISTAILALFFAVYSADASLLKDTAIHSPPSSIPRINFQSQALSEALVTAKQTITESKLATIGRLVIVNSILLSIGMLPAGGSSGSSAESLQDKTLRELEGAVAHFEKYPNFGTYSAVTEKYEELVRVAGETFVAGEIDGIRHTKNQKNGAFERRHVLVKGFNKKTGQIFALEPPKAVRDRIVEIAENAKAEYEQVHGPVDGQVEFFEVDDAEWTRLLGIKIGEELAEVKKAITDHDGVVKEELADLSEVLEAYVRSVVRSSAKQLSSQLSHGKADSRIAPPNYKQGITLENARSKPGKELGQTLFDLLFDLNAQVIGGKALDLALTKKFFHGNASQMREEYTRATAWLRNLPEIDNLTPPQLGRVIYSVIAQIVGDVDPHSELDNQNIESFRTVLPALKVRLGLNRISAPFIGRPHITPETRAILKRALGYGAISSQTDTTFFGIQKAAEGSGIITTGMDLTTEHKAQESLFKFAGDNGLTVATGQTEALLGVNADDSIPLMLLKIGTTMWDRDPKMQGEEQVDQWINNISANPMTPLIYAVDDKEDFVIVQLSLLVLLRAGFRVTVIGKQSPVMNDVTVDWLKTFIAASQDLQPYYRRNKLKVISSGNGIGGTDLANTSRELNDALVQHSAIFSWGSTNAESLLKGQQLALPVATASMDNQRRVVFEANSTRTNLNRTDLQTQSRWFPWNWFRRHKVSRDIEFSA